MKPKKQKKGFFMKLILTVNCILAVFLLISYLAPFVNPASFWPIAFFGLGYPFLLFANVGFVLFWIFYRAKYLFISLLSILIGWNVLTNTIGFRSSAAIAVPKSSDDFLRVVTYNVHSFKKIEGDEYDESNKDQILDLIRKEQPDVLCIQEFLTRKSGAFNTQKSLRDMLHARYQYFVASQDNDFEAMGLTIFSRYPISGQQSILFENTSRGNEAIWADVAVKNKKVRIYNIHLQSIGFEPQDYEYINGVKKLKKEEEGSGKRIFMRLKNAFIKRSGQAQLMKKYAESCKIPFVITGDFNDTPASYAVNTLANGIENTFTKKGSGFGVTYNGDFPNFQIDYILVSPQFKVINYRVLNKKLSDHYGVRSDLELK